MKTGLTLTIGFILGASALALATTGDRPAYLVVSGSYSDRDGMGAYYEAAQPLADQAGIEILARSDEVTQAQLLEGQWPGKGFVVVERFESMQALHKFWYSDAYQAAKLLRDGKVTMDFIIAVPGVE